jgi:hypothetical protein
LSITTPQPVYDARSPIEFAVPDMVLLCRRRVEFYLLGNSYPTKNVMATANPLFKAKPFEQSASPQTED